MPVLSGKPAKNSVFWCSALMERTTSGSRAQIRTSRPAAAQTWAKAVPQAPAPKTVTDWKARVKGMNPSLNVQAKPRNL
jgi:hypothetical protein